jgi:hypothetical protein
VELLVIMLLMRCWRFLIEKSIDLVRSSCFATEIARAYRLKIDSSVVWVSGMLGAVQDCLITRLVQVSQ